MLEPDPIEPDTFALGWEQTTGEADFSHLFRWRFREGATTETSSRVKARLVLHALVDLVPDEGLPDLIREIGRISEEYEPLPPLKMLASAPVSRIAKGKIVRRYERPTFPISEE